MLVFDTPTSVVQPTSSDIQALLEVGYAEAELPVQPSQPPTESIRVTMTVDPPAAHVQDISSDDSSLGLGSDSDDDSSASRFFVQACDAVAPSSPPAE